MAPGGYLLHSGGHYGLWSGLIVARPCLILKYPVVARREPVNRPRPTEPAKSGTTRVSTSRRPTLPSAGTVVEEGLGGATAGNYKILGLPESSKYPPLAILFWPGFLGYGAQRNGTILGGVPPTVSVSEWVGFENTGGGCKIRGSAVSNSSRITKARRRASRRWDCCRPCRTTLSQN